MKKGPIKPVRFAVVLGIVASLIFLALVGILSPGEFWGSVSTFAATLISVFAAFFVGVGLYDRQVRIADARKVEQLSGALVAELSETIEALKRAMIYRLPLPDRPHRDTIPVTYLRPVVLEDAARSRVFSSTFTRQMMQLARTIHLYNLQVSHLLSVVAPMQSIGEAYQDYVRYQLDLAQRTISNLRKKIIDQSEELIGTIQSRDHTVPDSADEVEPKLPWYRQLVGWQP